MLFPLELRIGTLKNTRMVSEILFSIPIEHVEIRLDMLNVSLLLSSWCTFLYTIMLRGNFAIKPEPVLYYVSVSIM